MKRGSEGRTVFVQVGVMKTWNMITAVAELCCEALPMS
jgi:hypothetical protein